MTIEKKVKYFNTKLTAAAFREYIYQILFASVIIKSEITYLFMQQVYEGKILESRVDTCL